MDVGIGERARYMEAASLGQNRGRAARETAPPTLLPEYRMRMQEAFVVEADAEHVVGDAEVTGFQVAQAALHPA